MQKITTFLWFDNQAEEAVNLYTSLFKNSRILEISRYGEGAPLPAGTVMTVAFQLEGQEFMALNGGPVFKFNEAMSLFVKCETQAEVDRYWEALSAGGEVQQCGWLKDRFGVSWQIIPTILLRYISDKDPQKSQAVMQAMLKMKKIDVSLVEKAYQG